MAGTKEYLISNSIKDFTINFHKNVAGKTEGNLVSSALSAHLVLSMAAYGAQGMTADQMLQALHLPDNDVQALQCFQNFINLLNNVPNVVLKLANKICVSKNFNIKNEYKEIISKHFFSESTLLDFFKAKESVEIINQWCNEKTNGKIQNIITEDDINPNTAVILLNAVYFKGNWKHKFDEINTELRPFHINKKTTLDVPTMWINENFDYRNLPELNADVVALPYENEDLALVIIVPKTIDGLEDIEKNLEKFNITRSEMGNREIELTLPKFKIESTIMLNPHLIEMGMTDMFTNGANFSSISDTPLKVDKVIQKAFLEVNEEGTEAAAVTAVIAVACCAYLPSPTIKLKVDRPFFYKIVYKNDILFSGRIVNPLV